MASFKAFLAAREAGTLGEDDERWYEVDADVVWIVDAPRADARMVDHRLRGERLRGALRGAYVRTLGAFADAARLRRCGGAFAAPMDELTLAHELRGRLAGELHCAAVSTARNVYVWGARPHGAAPPQPPPRRAPPRPPPPPGFFYSCTRGDPPGAV